MKHQYCMLIALLLASLVLAAITGLLAGKADGRADFAKWANRSARVLEPGDYNTNGTSSCAVCSWKGVQGIGNLGIGMGNISLMKPDVLDALINGSAGAQNSNETADQTANEADANKTASPGGSNSTIISAPTNNTHGNGTLVSKDTDVAPGPAPGAQAESPAGGPVTESLYPDYDLAASIIPRYAPYSITINKPFEHILAENPIEAAALYGKLIGLPMPSGQVIDVGIKCIGYEY